MTAHVTYTNAHTACVYVLHTYVGRLTTTRRRRRRGRISRFAVFFFFFILL